MMNENDSFMENSYKNSNQDNARNNENAEGREGYRAYNRDNNYQQRGAQRPQGQGQRPHRPRFNRSEHTYSSDNKGFRPQTYSNNDYQRGGQQQYGQQRPQYGNHRQQEGGYRPQQEGGYRPQQQDAQRPSFSRNHTTYTHGYRPNQQGGGYRQQNNYGNNRQGGYNQQRPRYNNGQQGGYGNNEYGQQRPHYNNQQQGGYGQRPAQQKYKPRKQQGEYDPNAKYSHKKRIEYKEYIEDPDAPIRLNKFLANAGVCSRREADDFIQAGVVKVNGQTVSELGTKINRTDIVHFHDQLVSIEKKVYVLLNKPKDYVTSSDDPQARKTVMDLVKNCCRERIYPVGRLDRNTTGVLLFTNDGDLASKLTHPKFLKKKIYHVYLDKNVAASDLKRIAEGVELEDGEIHADAISYASDTDKSQVGIEIHSGKNRIVRRIFEHLGYRVMKLDRVMFAGLTKKGLKRGDWRFLTEQEVAMLHVGSFE